MEGNYLQKGSQGVLVLSAGQVSFHQTLVDDVPGRLPTLGAQPPGHPLDGQLQRAFSFIKLVQATQELHGLQGWIRIAANVSGGFPFSGLAKTSQ